MFSDAKDLGKIRVGSRSTGHQMQVGYVKIGDFRQVTHYSSKMVRDTCIVSIKVEYEVINPQPDGDIANDLG